MRLNTLACVCEAYMARTKKSNCLLLHEQHGDNKCFCLFVEMCVCELVTIKNTKNKQKRFLCVVKNASQTRLFLYSSEEGLKLRLGRVNKCITIVWIRFLCVVFFGGESEFWVSLVTNISSSSSPKRHMFSVCNVNIYKKRGSSLQNRYVCVFVSGCKYNRVYSEYGLHATCVCVCVLFKYNCIEQTKTKIQTVQLSTIQL